MVSSTYGSGKVKLRWDHASGYVEIATDSAPEHWVRWSVSEWRDFLDALETAVAEADSR